MPLAATYRRVAMKALARYQIILLGEQRHIGVNNLSKVVARQCSGRELNPWPPDHESNTLATTPPSHLLGIWFVWHSPRERRRAWTIAERCACFVLIVVGYKYMFDEKLVTVWSAPNYCYRCGNIAAILSINDTDVRDAKLFRAVADSDRVIPPRNTTPYFL